MLEESEDIHNDLEAMTEKLQYLDSVYHTETMSQQVADLGRETEELRQVIKIRLQSLHDAAKVKKKKKKGYLNGKVYHYGLPRWHSGKDFSWQCRRHKSCSFDPWVGKIPWNKKWQPTSVFLPGKFYGQRSLANYSPGGRKESDMTERLSAHIIKNNNGTSLAVQWLRLCAANAKDMGSIPGRGDKIPLAVGGCCDHKIK